MKIASRHDLIAIREDQRIVRDTIDLDLERGPHMVEGIAHRAVHLWHAAQTVGILHPRTADVGGANRAAGHQSREVRGDGVLAAIGPQFLYAWLECDRRALERLHR